MSNVFLCTVFFEFLCWRNQTRYNLRKKRTNLVVFCFYFGCSSLIYIVALFRSQKLLRLFSVRLFLHICCWWKFVYEPYVVWWWNWSAYDEHYSRSKYNFTFKTSKSSRCKAFVYYGNWYERLFIWLLASQWDSDSQTHILIHNYT